MPGNYIHSLQVGIQKEIGHINKLDNIVDLSTSPKILAPSAEENHDESRSRGDWTIYKYYARALGPWGLMGFLILIATNGTFTGMGSEFYTLNGERH